MGKWDINEEEKNPPFNAPNEMENMMREKIEYNEK